MLRPTDWTSTPTGLGSYPTAVAEMYRAAVALGGWVRWKTGHRMSPVGLFAGVRSVGVPYLAHHRYFGGVMRIQRCFGAGGASFSWFGAPLRHGPGLALSIGFGAEMLAR